jgi:hypothetical protein
MDARDREAELAAGVAAAHDELVQVMREPVKRGELPDDVARRLLKQHEEAQARGCAVLTTAERQAIQKALDRYTKAVNDAWLHAENSGITKRCVAVWLQRARKDRAGLAGLDREDYETEATFAMRGVVATFRAKGGASLYAYAFKHIDEALRTLRGQALSAVQLPDRVARNTFASNRAESNDLMDRGEQVPFEDGPELDAESFRRSRGYEDELIDRIDRAKSGRALDD